MTPEDEAKLLAELKQMMQRSRELDREPVAEKSLARVIDEQRELRGMLERVKQLLAAHDLYMVELDDSVVPSAEEHHEVWRQWKAVGEELTELARYRDRLDRETYNRRRRELMREHEHLNLKLTEIGMARRRHERITSGG